MASKPPLSTVSHGVHKHACSTCARRKVKCDKVDPCANCVKAEVKCEYDVVVASRPRKRAIDGDLLTRLSLYEGLMRKHNIDFSSYTHTWIPSPVPESRSDGGNRAILTEPQTVIISQPRGLRPDARDHETTETERCLWFDMSSELKYHSIQNLRYREDPFSHLTPLQLAFPSDQAEIHRLHPEPRHIFRLWQIFVEQVHPITKIVHAPTLQQRILDVSWDPAQASKSLSAIMFAIYTIAVTPMSSAECEATFGESHNCLLKRYRAATGRALLAAEFLTTRDLEVLQALVLFLLSDPESELTTTLAGSAMRLGQRMGLHRDNSDDNLSFFEKEMRIRLWWQVRCMDTRSRAVSAPLINPVKAEYGDARLPLNVNDADLHPDMVASPIEHDGPTEMLCVLLKFQVFIWMRTSPKTTKVFDGIVQGAARGAIPVEVDDANDAVDELERMYQQRYTNNCDEHIPLHGLTRTIAAFIVARIRFKIHHPRRRAAANGSNEYVTPETSDTLFESALTCIELVDATRRGKLSSHLFTHMTLKFELDVFIYVISELRQRCTGDRVAAAWKMVEAAFNEHTELIEDLENTFFTALGDLTVEAWDARRKEIAGGEGALEYDVTPGFIRSLWDKREARRLQNVQITAIADFDGLEGFGLMDDLNREWWSEFMQL